VRVLALRRGGPLLDELRQEGIPAEIAGIRSRFDLAGFARAFALAQPAPDVVVSQSLNAQVLGQLVARRGRAVHLTIEHAGPGLGVTPLQRRVSRVLARRYDGVVAVSASQLPELGELGYAEEQIRVIPYGVPEPVPVRDRAAVCAELGVAESDFVAILVAGLRPEKRVDLFIDAIAAARARDARIRGVVAGGGDLLEEIRSRAALRGGVSILAERSDVADLVAAADVVCLTSRTEALPLAILEAMALGKPVVAVAVGGIPSVVAHGRTGVLVEDDGPDAFAAELCELARAPDRVGALGHAARQLYEASYTVEHAADAYASLIGELLARHERS
jgi:glycosyltransferase involved in cell wall biosynthesis